MTMRVAACVVLGILASVRPNSARADGIPTPSVFIDLSIAVPPTPILPGDELGGTAQFWEQLGPALGWTPLSDPIPGNPVKLGQTLIITFFPPNPCLGSDSCSIGFSFGGTAGGLPAIAFQTLDDAPASPTTVPPTPIIPITDSFEPPDPCFQGAACNASGPIVGYQLDPQSVGQIGTWNASIGITPLPAALPLLATGLGVLGLLGWRRKRKAPIAA